VGQPQQPANRVARVAAQTRDLADGVTLAMEETDIHELIQI
jgi:hypothetical protein